MRFSTSKNIKHLSFLFLILLIGGECAQLSNCSPEKVNKVIDDTFSGIKMGQIDYKTESPNPSEVNQCLGINYDKDDEENFAEMREIIYGDFCDNITDTNEGTCKSINATIKSYVTLKDMGCFPVFRNYLPAWKNKNYDSVACETGSFDLDSKSFVKGKENGCNGFGLCDTLRMILTLSANQRRLNDCGPTAALTLLSNSNPVKALKVATQLMWTGQTEILGKHQPCEYIYDQQPGVQDMPSKNTTLDEFCGAADKRIDGCEKRLDYLKRYDADPAITLYFQVAPGLEYMWAQSALSSNLRAQNDNGCTPEGLQLVHVNKSNAVEVKPYHLSTTHAAYYWCNVIIDNINTECQIVMNLKNKKPVTMTDSAYVYWTSGAYSNAITDVQIYGGTPSSTWTGGAKDYIEGIECSLNPGTQSSGESYTNFQQNPIKSQPQITESMLNDACAKTESADHGVMMAINGDIFNDELPLSIPQKCVNGTEPYCTEKSGLYPTCDHMVVLLKCDIPSNNYTIWSFATEYHFKKEILIADNNVGIGGSICSMVIAGPKTNYIAPASEPYPCSGGASPSWMLPLLAVVVSVSSLCYAVL